MDTDGYSSDITYDENGNKLSVKTSQGFIEETEFYEVE